MKENTSIHIGIGNPEEVTTADLMTFPRVLDSEEQESYAAFKNDAARLQYLLSHVLMRLMLSRKLHAHPAEVRFKRIKGQKPCLDDRHRENCIDFNISHTQGCVACAVIESGAIGIDVEYLDRSLNTDLIAPYSLTEPEMRYINSYNEAERHDKFLHIWTLKEAFLKGHGIGFQLPPSDIQVDVATLASTAIRVRRRSMPENDRWHFRQFHPSNIHIGAIAFAMRHAIKPLIVIHHMDIRSIRNTLRAYDSVTMPVYA